jgi:phospholipid/cholesterol/gamma-HCH transport system substrate-binding protein
MAKGRSAIRRCAGLLLGVAVALASASCGGEPEARAINYCALLPDSVGLYVGNPVTQMGLQIGTVNKLTPSNASVQVDFSATDARPLPHDVKAVVRSVSILADRALELVGNYEGGPKLEPGQCVPLGRSATPKSLSQTIGAANTFITGITPENSTNIGDVINQLDQATTNRLAGINQVLNTSSELLDSPDQAIGDMKSIVGNLATLTETLVAMRDPLKQILNDALITNPYIIDSTIGVTRFTGPLGPIAFAVGDIEVNAGDEVQLTLDVLSDVLRINTPHTLGWVSALGGILKPLPWWINSIANHYNNLNYFPLSYRPPLYRIRTPNGAVVCNVMNFSNPGSCANVAGQPYAVDINLLQYVFMNASQ